MEAVDRDRAVGIAAPARPSGVSCPHPHRQLVTATPSSLPNPPTGGGKPAPIAGSFRSAPDPIRGQRCRPRPADWPCSAVLDLLRAPRTIAVPDYPSSGRVTLRIRLRI